MLEDISKKIICGFYSEYDFEINFSNRLTGYLMHTNHFLKIYWNEWKDKAKSDFVELQHYILHTQVSLILKKKLLTQEEIKRYFAVNFLIDENYQIESFMISRRILAETAALEIISDNKISISTLEKFLKYDDTSRIALFDQAQTIAKNMNTGFESTFNNLKTRMSGAIPFGGKQ